MWKHLGAWELRSCRMKCPGGLGAQKFLDPGSLIIQMVRLREKCSLHDIVSAKLSKFSGAYEILLRGPASFTKLGAFADVLPSSAHHSLSSIEVLLLQGPAPVLFLQEAFCNLWCPLLFSESYEHSIYSSSFAITLLQTNTGIFCSDSLGKLPTLPY